MFDCSDFNTQKGCILMTNHCGTHISNRLIVRIIELNQVTYSYLPLPTPKKAQAPKLFLSQFIVNSIIISHGC